MNLSQHFSLNELLQSDAAIRLEFSEQFEPSQEIVSNLEALCVNVLEPLRIAIGKPINITSGYRCPRLNSAIGGASISQHTIGQAADINVDGMLTEDLYQLIKKDGFRYDQLIQEFNRWVHVSYKEPPRKSCLIATKVNGQTLYTPDK